MAAISVVMGVYNESSDYLIQSVDSILNQTFSDFEFIIILDNPANEMLKQILQDYAKRDSRICFLINEKNIGLAMTLNRGIKMSTGKYIARMDADDIALPERLEKQYSYLENNPLIDILATNIEYIDEKGLNIGHGEKQPVSSDKIKRMLAYVNILAHSSVMMRKDKILSIGLYRNFPTSQDRDLWSRAVSADFQFGMLNECLLKYRLNSQGISSSKSYMQTLISLYISLLTKEREKTGEDSFSEKNLKLFLEKYRAYDNIEISKFQIARDCFETARMKLKNRHFVSGVGLLIKSMCKHSLIRKRIYNIFRVVILKIF